MFVYMEFRNLAIFEKERELINIDRIRIYYSLRDLLSGKALNSLKEIRIIKSSFSFDYEKDKDLIKLFTNTEQASGKLNLPDVKISGKNLTVNLKKADDEIKLTRFFFSLEHKDNSTRFTTKGNLRTSIRQQKYLSGTAIFSVSGSIQNNYDLSNTLLVFKSIENDFIASDKISLRVSYKSGQFILHKVEDSRPLDIRLGYSDLDKIINVNFACEDFIPLDYFKSKKIDPSILQWLGTSISGSGEFLYNTDNKKITYSADILANTNNSSIPKQAVINSTLTGDNSVISFSNLKIETLDGIVIFKGNLNYNNFLPEGNLFIFYNNPLTKVKANFSFNQRDNRLNIIGDNLSINDMELFNFKTSLNIFNKDIDFKTSFNLKNLQNQMEDQVTIDGNIQYKPDFFLNLSLNTKNMPINSFIESLPSITNKYFKDLPVLSFDSELFISTDLKQFSFSSSKIQISSDKDDYLKFTAFGNNDSIDIGNISLKFGDNILNGSIKTDISKKSIHNTVNLIYEENSYSANISYYPNRGLYVEGMYGLLGEWYKSGDVSEFSLSLEDFPISVNGDTTKISFKTNGLYTDSQKWQANIDILEFFNIPGIRSGNRLSLIGEISNNVINFTSIDYSDSISILHGSGFIDHNLFSLEDLKGDINLYSTEEEKYISNFSFQEKIIEFKTEFTKAPLDRFNKIPVSGLVNGNLTLNGLLPEPNINITLQLEKGEFNSSPLEIETSLELTEEKFQINYLRLKYKNQVLQKGNGEYNLETGDFSMNLEYLGVVKDKNIKAFIGISGESDLLKNRPSLSEIFKSNYNSKFTISNILVNNVDTDSWDFQISRKNKKINFNGGPDNSLSGYLENSGLFSIISGKGLPLRGKAEGLISENKIDISIRDLEVDLTLLNLINFDKFLKFTNGTARGYLDITGEFNDPQFNGSLNVNDAEANVFMIPEKIKAFSAKITAEDGKIKIGPEILSINKSSVKIGMELIFNKWIPNTYLLEIETLNQDSIRVIYDVPSIGLGIDGYVTGGINISQDEYGTNIDSELIAEDCIINLGSISNKDNKSEQRTSINMLFITGKKVQFIWPSIAIPILNATAEQGQAIKLEMDNLNGTFSLKGEVNIKYGGIYYFQKSFYLSEGLIGFDENESKFDPLLAFTAQIKEVDAEGEVVNISLIQDKLPVSQFAPRFESDPPLSDVEIFSILGAGVFTDIGNEQIDLTSALLLTGDLVAQFAIIRNIEKKVRNIFNLDLFSLRTQMIQNLLLDRFIQKESVDQEVYSESFGRYLDNTTLYLGKYIGDDIFLQALLQINNLQFIDTDLYATNKLLIESTISLEWQTPLFLLGFSVKPDFVDPVSSIHNTSLELSWGYSY